MKASRILQNTALRRIVQEAQKDKLPLYLVGGVVRSRVCNPDDEVTNIDLLVLGDVGLFTKKIATLLKSKQVVINPKFETVLIPAKKIEFEFSGPKNLIRIDEAQIELPEDRLERDLLLRDFTINAIALALSPERGKIVDPSGGQNDMKKCVIRTPISPRITLQEDPLRIMRAARFAAQLNFSIDPELLKAMHELRHSIASVSVERISAELLSILSTSKPSIGLNLLYMTGFLDVTFPEIAKLGTLQQNKSSQHKNIFEHTMKVVDAVANVGGSLQTRIAALLHDIGKPATRRYDAESGWTFHGHEVIGERMAKKVGKNLRLPSATIHKVTKLVRLHMRPINLSDEGVTDSAVRRLSTQAGEDIDDLITLCRADVTSSDPRRVKRYLANFEKVVAHLREVSEKDDLRSFQSPVRGDVIMAETGLPPGPTIGKLKKAIEEAIIDGLIPNEYDAALSYLRENKDSILETSEPSKTK